ncbi:MAG: glycosyltransferase family 4 protein [Alphaproteobacteria bacterium]|nr:glycosyltransferase family 4 protein [Alphaproteobacteria bacterium]
MTQFDPFSGLAGADPSIDAGASEERLPVVLQVIPELNGGGVERGTVDIAIALKAAGWGSVVASAGGAMVRQLARSEVAHVTLPLKSKNPLVMHANIRRLKQVIRRHGVDIVHARSRAPAWSAEAAAKRTGARFVTTVHGTYDAASVFKRRYNAVMMRGERVIAISRFIARHIQDTYGLDPALIRMIHRGVDLDVFAPARVTQERMIQLATNWKLPDDRQVILMPGRFSRWKGHQLLVEALALLDRRDVLCVMVGADTSSKDYLAAIEKRARDLHVLELLRFVDFSRDLPAAYMLSDVVVSAATRPEAFGRTLAEALAMGRPVVGPDHGGAQEILSDGGIGWLFEPGDAGSLAAALQAALSLNSGARHRFAEEAVRWIRAEFANERMCAETLAVYEDVLFGAGAGEGAAA